jgi:hypothetical protein
MAALEAVARLKASAAPRAMARALVRIISRILMFRLTPLASILESARRETIIEADKDNDRPDRQTIHIAERIASALQKTDDCLFEQPRAATRCRSA